MSARKIAFAAVIAAVYASLTVINPWGYGLVQFRVAEVLCILPFFFPSAVWGLFVGCIIANLVSAYGVYDVVFGSLASLLAALCTMRLGRLNPRSAVVKALACLPPVVFNGLIIGALISIFTPSQAYWAAAASVALGQFGVMYALGLPAMLLLPKTGLFRALSSYYSR